jgi:hypothetical protein
MNMGAGSEKGRREPTKNWTAETSRAAFADNR